MNLVIFGHDADNVVTCCKPLKAGDEVKAGSVSIRAKQPIPIYHKMALCEIRTGEKVYKYGQPIGVASRDIAPGEHVHTHNLESARGRGDRKGGRAL